MTDAVQNVVSCIPGRPMQTIVLLMLLFEGKGTSKRENRQGDHDQLEHLTNPYTDGTS